MQAVGMPDNTEQGKTVLKKVGRCVGYIITIIALLLLFIEIGQEFYLIHRAWMMP